MVENNKLEAPVSEQYKFNFEDYTYGSKAIAMKYKKDLDILSKINSKPKYPK